MFFCSKYTLHLYIIYNVYESFHTWRTNYKMPDFYTYDLVSLTCILISYFKAVTIIFLQKALQMSILKPLSWILKNKKTKTHVTPCYITSFYEWNKLNKCGPFHFIAQPRWYVYDIGSAGFIYSTHIGLLESGTQTELVHTLSIF